MFIHLSMQDFLAANHIARNTHLIDVVLSVYLNRHEYVYLDLSHVFILLCGLDVSGAEKLSSMMDKRDALLQCGYIGEFQNIILAGYREAIANGHTDISLKLRRFFVDEFNIIELHRLWTHNTVDAILLRVHIKEMKAFET
ncbi:hypothetical protein DPMN_175662 [Dreissena polymorpha]|uniref:Uncharacterized protein n=1 Tax=Dreissena polymorpha TaxID=45954 RepID=A0A9D4E8K9_DREPO|nr:hypothetical protein DPMN_175662 [Dreissena polymorpha]